MSLFTKLFEAVHSWRRRRGGLKSRKRVDLAMEQLDHRQLLAVNFTGNVPIDFPVTNNTGVAIVNPGPPMNTVPTIPVPLQGIVNVSGFQINDLRVLYTPTDDTLNVGLEGPLNGRDARQVIATDADNNGNSGTVDPRVAAAEPGFADPPDAGQTESYGIFLNLNNTALAPNSPATPDIVAGFPIGNGNDQGPKPFEVARAATMPGTGPTVSPKFDQNNVFPQYTGNYYLANDPNHPNFELQITHFSQLYQQITGKALTPTTTIGIGAFGNSAQDIGLGDEFFPPNDLTLGQASPPVVPAIAIAKSTDGQLAPTAPGPSLAAGEVVTWNYDVTNPGTDPLRNVVVIDDGGTPGVAANQITPVFAGGDTNGNGLLDPGEDFRFIAQGIVQPGQYQNTVAVTGVGTGSGTPVGAVALSHYFGTTPVTPPPTILSPTIYINPHENNHINSAHPSAVRVNILGSSGFNPTTINPASVRLGSPGTSAISGAAPILNFERNVNHDQFPDETFVFNGQSLNLPPGVTEAEISGQTTSGQMFASTVQVFNRDYSYYNQPQINQQQAAFAKYDQRNNIPVTTGNFVAPPPRIPTAAQQRAATMAIDDLYNPFLGKAAPAQVNAAAVGVAQAASAPAMNGPAVAIKTRHGKAPQAKAVHVSTVKHKGPSIQQLVAGGA